MEILRDKSVNFNGVTLILGFFDGVHLGHRNVIKSAIEFAKNNNSKTCLLTFSDSPAKYFKGNTEYIYPREYNYKIIEKLDVDYIIETDFSQLVNLTAEEYLKYITEKYSPIAIFTGFNHTFGKSKSGTPEYLAKNQKKYGYKYFCTEPVYKDGEIVSSTRIKTILKNCETEKAGNLLSEPYSVENIVTKGNQIGRTIGFPTANIQYPENTVKLPYGVYKVNVFDKPAILNWGIKPTLGENKEILEVHIPDFEGNLYGEKIKLEFIKKIRDEKKFNNLEELKSQIKKDTAECLK